MSDTDDTLNLINASLTRIEEQISDQNKVLMKIGAAIENHGDTIKAVAEYVLTVIYGEGEGEEREEEVDGEGDVFEARKSGREEGF